jgi:hypothetical protein
MIRYQANIRNLEHSSIKLRNKSSLFSFPNLRIPIPLFIDFGTDTSPFCFYLLLVSLVPWFLPAE